MSNHDDDSLSSWQHDRRTESLAAGAILALLLLGALTLVLTGCWPASRHTGDLRAMQTAAVRRCKADDRACDTARACTRAAVKASEAWVAFARLRAADKKHAAGDGQPIDLMALSGAEKEANGLEDAARAACALEPNRAIGGGPTDFGMRALSPADLPPPDAGAPAADLQLQLHDMGADRAG